MSSQVEYLRALEALRRSFLLAEDLGKKGGDFVGKSQVFPWENTNELKGNLIYSNIEVFIWENQL